MGTVFINIACIAAVDIVQAVAVIIGMTAPFPICRCNLVPVIYKIKIDPVHFEDTDAVIGFIINIENITEYAKLENMRKEFVANVSH